jgi:hypothetical protein
MVATASHGAMTAVEAGRANGFRPAGCAAASGGAEIAAGLPKPVQKDRERGARRATHRHHLQALTRMPAAVDGTIRMKASVDVTRLTPDRLALYAELGGWVLARAHARTGNAARTARYLGNGAAFDGAVVAFATASAGQTERDHAALAAVASGRIAAITDR